MIFERILVPTDFSDASLAALRSAATFAKSFGSRVTLLHASRFASSIYLDHPLGFYFESSPAPKLALQARLRTLAAHFAPALHVETLVVDGDPVDAIVRAADDVDADLIIMTARSGAIAQRVKRATRRPVLAVDGVTPARRRRPALHPAIAR